MRVARIGPPVAVVLLVVGLIAPTGAAARGIAPSEPSAAPSAAPDLTVPPVIATIGPTGGNGDVSPVWMVTSADGSHVVFRTREVLTADDTNARLDLYDWSRADGVRLITAGSTSEPTYEATRISSNGEHVFVFTPDPLLPADTDANTDVYEWSQGHLTLVSTGATDTGTSFSYPWAATPDGTVYFTSSGRLTASDTDDEIDLYAGSGGAVTLLSTTATAGNGPYGVNFNGMSADGSHVFFQTQEELDPADTDAQYDLYEWSSSGVAFLSTGPTDVGGNDGGYQASTADGTHVYFSTGGQLTSEDTDVNADTYERFAGVTRLVSKGASGEEAGNYSRVQAASADGSVLVIDVAGRLGPADLDNSIDTYVVDHGAPTLLLGGLDAENFVELHGITPDGSRIAFSTRASLVAVDTDGATDIYVHAGGSNELVSRAPGDPNFGLDAQFWAMSADGERILFKTGEPLDAGDPELDYDVAIWEDGSVVRLPIASGASGLLEFNGASDDATRLFVRDGARLVPADTDSAFDIYQFSLPEALTFTPAPGAPASVPQMGRFERQFQLSRDYGTDANDPSVVDVTGRFVSPTGRIFTTPAYFGLDYTVQPGTGVASSENYLPVALDPPAPGIWHVRFSPDEVGTWTYTLRATDHVPSQETTAISGVLSFDVTPSAALGQVVRDPRDDRFLRYQDGTPYYPMGHNVAFQQGEPEGNDGEHYVEPLFASMEAAGQNWTRIWMTDFNRNALEWSSGGWPFWYTGVGQYADQSAFRIERQLDAADDHGLQVQLVINDHGQLSSRGADRWDRNPYNAANGGPVDAAHPEQFFTNAEARELFKHRLRYLVARYGAYRNVLAWELFNEVQFVGSDTVYPAINGPFRSEIVAWHTEMAAYLRSIDPYLHLITTSSDIESSLKDIWSDPNIDLVQVHDYDAALTTRDTRFQGYVETLNGVYHKPVIIGEFGLYQSPEINFDPVAQAPLDDREQHLLESTHLHNAAWSAAMSGSGAMSWWWGAYIHSSSLRHRSAPQFPANERINPPLRDFFADEDLAGMTLEPSVISRPASIVALGLDNGSRGFAWIRDALNEYGTGVGPGHLAGRTLSGVHIAVGGFTDGPYRIEIHDPWGVNAMVETSATAVGGTLSVALPDFTRDLAIKIRPGGPPGAPTSVAAAAGDASATVTWVAPANDGGSQITGYTVTSSPGGLSASAGGTATSATVSGLTNGIGYTFTVTASNAVGTGPASSASNSVTPVAKANQTITFGTLNPRTMIQPPVVVSATASSGLPVTFSTDTATVCTAGGTNGATITSVAAGTCIVRADQAGNAAFNPAPSVLRSFLVSKVNQSITFGALPNRTMAQAPFTVSATASSGLPVTFASTTETICATGGLNGSTVTIVAVGTCSITASQAGNATYNVAPDRIRTFTVTLAPQTITFPAIANKTLPQSPITAAPTASSGLPVTVTTSTPTICTPGGANGTTVTLVAPGTCTLLANQPGNATWAAAPQKTASFTVARAGQTITFTNPGPKNLLQSPLTVTATASSLLTVTFTTTTPAVCTSGGVNGATITLVATGSCSVVAAQPGNANYAPAPSITRTFTVSRVPQTIAFGTLRTRHILETPFTVSATSSSGLTVTFTSSSKTVCAAGGANGTSITLLKAGTCRIAASQAGDAIYAPAPTVTQSFTVTTARLAQTITFGPLGSRSAGEPPLTLTATASSGLRISYAVAPASAAVCSVAGSTLTLHTAGSCTVTATQSGNASYLAAPAVSQVLAATPAGFVQAAGTGLVLDGQPFEIFGAALFETSNNGHTADVDQVFAWAHAANLNTLRLTDIFLQTTNDPGAPYDEDDWEWIDGLIARAGDEGFKVILDLSSYRNWIVWSSEINLGWVTNCRDGAPDRDQVDYTLLDPYTVAHRADWTAFMTFVANRLNTVSGVAYRDDPTILVVSIAGEPVGAGFGRCGKASTEQELTDFFAWALAEWKSLDPYHLRSTGGLGGTYAGLDGSGNPIPSGQLIDGIALFGLADNTLPSLHTYPAYPTALPLADGQTPVLAPVAQALGKPWFTEEFGFRQVEGDAYRSSLFDAVYAEQAAYGSAGSLFWNLGPEIGDDTFDVNPSTPLTWARVLAEAP